MNDLEKYLLQLAYETICKLQVSYELDSLIDYTEFSEKLENCKILLEEVGYVP